MSRHHPAFLFLVILLLSNLAAAGDGPSAPGAPLSLGAVAEGRLLADLNSSPIQDNSFLVEEAYNQEDGVIQHITFFQRLSTGDWAFTQSDEWPLHSLKHQLSVTLAATHADGVSGAGWGDTFINYRYQLVGSGDTRLAISPRFSLLLPTGSAAAGRGMGGTGMQVNLPVSLELNKRLVTHWNVGATWVPRAQNNLGQRADSLGVNLGQSIVWLASNRFNALVETVWTSTPQVAGPGVTTPDHNLFISPGVRWAYNFRNGLQIVPGVGMPVGVGPSPGQIGAIFYLSFEHGMPIAHSKH
jgi:hypothetical protein